MISPDGRWIAYQSDETGVDQIYVRAFPSMATKRAISTGGGSNPVWASRGNELFFRGPDGMMVADYSATNGLFEPKTPRLWAAKRDLARWFDISPDGRRVIIVENDVSENRSPAQVTFVLNFFDELRRRVPAVK